MSKIVSADKELVIKFTDTEGNPRSLDDIDYSTCIQELVDLAEADGEELGRHNIEKYIFPLWAAHFLSDSDDKQDDNDSTGSEERSVKKQKADKDDNGKKSKKARKHKKGKKGTKHHQQH